MAYIPSVAIENRENIAYINGNETTDGSKRLIIDPGGDFVQLEARTLGAWQHSELGLGVSSLFLGPDLGLSTAGAHFMTERQDGTHKHLYPHVHLDEINGTSNKLLSPKLGLKIFNFPIQSNDTGEFIGTVFEEAPFASPFSGMVTKTYLKIGSVAATMPVRLQIWEGIDDTGTLIWDFNYPASSFSPADTTLEEDIPGFLELRAGAPYFAKYSSTATFSLLTNAADNSAWNEVDFYPVTHEALLSTEEWIAGIVYTKGDWVIDSDSKKIYVCNVTALQLGSWEGNAFRWDKLISVQGFDRIVTTNAGEVAPDILGNLIISN